MKNDEDTNLTSKNEENPSKIPLIIGSISIVISLLGARIIPIIPGLILSITGIFISLKKRKKSDDKSLTTALYLNIFAFIISILYLIAVLAVFLFFKSMLVLR